MPKPGFKALLAVLSLRRGHKSRPHWDEIIIVLSTAVTLGLFALWALQHL